MLESSGRVHREPQDRDARRGGIAATAGRPDRRQRAGDRGRHRAGAGDRWTPGQAADAATVHSHWAEGASTTPARTRPLVVEGRALLSRLAISARLAGLKGLLTAGTGPWRGRRSPRSFGRRR